MGMQANFRPNSCVGANRTHERATSNKFTGTRATCGPLTLQQRGVHPAYGRTHPS